MNSISPITEYFISFLCIIISICILILYISKKINIVECIIYAFVTQAYSIAQIGPTITTFYLVQTIIAFLELCYLFKNRDNFKIKKIFILLFLLPIISYLFCFVDFFFKIRNHFYILGSPKSLFLTGPFFYIKTYIPFFLLISRLSREIRFCKFSFFFEILHKVALLSCIVGIFQYVLNLSTSNIDLKAIFGLKAAYQSDSLEKIRISAFFQEPKHFSAFLALVIPYCGYKKKYLNVALFLLIGILTISQTFYICLICFFISFFLFKKIQNVRLVIVYSLSILLFLTSLISLLKNDLIKNVYKYQDSFIYALIIERAINRYDIDDVSENNELLGLPLQVDLERPVVNFLKDNGYLFIMGYGPGNGKFIPPNYFESNKMNYRYYKQLEENAPVHMNMRWIYVMAEFGVIFFCIFFWRLTSVKFYDNFSTHYYAYFWLIFFFNEIDILLIIFYFLFFTQRVKQLTLYHNNGSTT